jgi:hypothetical protein
MLNLFNLPDKFNVLKISTSLYSEYISGGLLKHWAIRYKSSRLRQLWAFHYYPWPEGECIMQLINVLLADLTFYQNLSTLVNYNFVKQILPIIPLNI